MKVLRKVFFIICVLALTACVKTLTVERLNDILEKKHVDDLTWSDFANFRREVDKGGDRIWIYQLDDGSTLILQGSKDDDKPKVISLVEINGESTLIKNEQ